MAGKVLAVATLASITGFLNLASMSLTVLAGAHMVSDQVQAIPFALPWLRVAAVLIVVPPAAFLFASVMVAMGALVAQLQGGADAADAGLLPVHGAVVDRGARGLPDERDHRRHSQPWA